MDQKCLDWRSTALNNGDGIVVGADIGQEWMLPWWWKRYEKHNGHKVAFVDFGMSFKKKSWCEERGELIPLRILDDFVRGSEELDPQMGSSFEKELGKRVWSCRKVWFKKPLAMLQTPFKRSIWIDLDCEIRGAVEPLFSYADLPVGIGMVKELFATALPYPLYNSGVIPYRRNLELIADWARSCIEKNGEFSGDQEVFSHLISERNLSIGEPPAKYNWSRMHSDDRDALIVHWHGQHGKTAIRHQINVEEISL